MTTNGSLQSTVAQNYASLHQAVSRYLNLGVVLAEANLHLVGNTIDAEQMRTVQDEAMCTLMDAMGKLPEPGCGPDREATCWEPKAEHVAHAIETLNQFGKRATTHAIAEFIGGPTCAADVARILKDNRGSFKSVRGRGRGRHAVYTLR